MTYRTDSFTIIFPSSSTIVVEGEADPPDSCEERLLDDDGDSLGEDDVDDDGTLLLGMVCIT